ncbi:gluconokinase [Sphingomonas sp. TDK1]|uniref:gluconokinase n=1 Tax=Sphingomonas sp. TDK1 TaxID=453247 RepID=UPI0007D91447|nr:gluconokinase [Sphingomonas sp. TDK1]OAN62181.1 gluconokinase [Sphingomonas sp. TDK1]
MPNLPARSPAAAAVIVMGVSGCGKSTLGALLAEGLGCTFLEGDAFHSVEAVTKMRDGTPLTDADRWPWLDRIAAAATASIETCGNAIAACSALRRVYRDRLRAGIPGGVQFVLLEADRAQLLARMSARPGHFMPTSLLDSQLATLERPLPDEGVLTLPAQQPPPVLRDAVLAYLERSALRA